MGNTLDTNGQSGFGASAVWRTRHNVSFIVHDWGSSVGGNVAASVPVPSRRYLYATDYQFRTALGDDGQRVIAQN